MRAFLLMMLVPMLAAATPESKPAPGGTVTFQVLDETDPKEISEDTVIFIDGRLVAHFILDKLHTSQTETVVVPAAAHYDYALCGRITVMRPDGGRDQRVVDGGATLTEVNGHLFRALAANDFTIFYLAEANEEVPEVPKDARHTNACSLPIS